MDIKAPPILRLASHSLDMLAMIILNAHRPKGLKMGYMYSGLSPRATLVYEDFFRTGSSQYLRSSMLGMYGIRLLGKSQRYLELTTLNSVT